MIERGDACIVDVEAGIESDLNEGVYSLLVLFLILLVNYM